MPPSHHWFTSYVLSPTEDEPLYDLMTIQPTGAAHKYTFD